MPRVLQTVNIVRATRKQYNKKKKENNQNFKRYSYIRGTRGTWKMGTTILEKRELQIKKEIADKGYSSLHIIMQRERSFVFRKERLWSQLSKTNKKLFII